ncbi:phage holin family protein [Altererythrobacter arenosus]|uniref:Phage holin family protein n=1 Tax=Altererythrobacter arenosus TaxID=3032592 RepID=A0ABY8FYA9_9SPHN|nr:phage holin family protein [Altererythrobacter sp. CAU 1644]WFL76984.1 phage holin family protein [Altererythrobacter sp. CAU 1644]
MRDDDLPDSRQDNVEDELDVAIRGGDEPDVSGSSLTEDIVALIDDGKTYAEAEYAFQKSRAAFAAERGKSAAVLVFFAFSFVHLALVALVVGMVIALAPSLTAWGATALVVVVLLIAAAILLMMMRKHTRAIGDAFADDR